MVSTMVNQLNMQAFLFQPKPIEPVVVIGTASCEVVDVARYEGSNSYSLMKHRRSANLMLN